MAALTEKQKRFCDEYLTDLNATQAAIRAGYSARSARQHAHVLLDRPQIRERIDARLAEMEEARVAKGDEVLKYLTSVMRGEETAVKIAVAGDVLESKTYVEQKNQLKAAELLARCHGLMIQGVNHSGDVGITFVDDLPDDDG